MYTICFLLVTREIQHKHASHINLDFSFLRKLSGNMSSIELVGHYLQNSSVSIENILISQEGHQMFSFLLGGTSDVFGANKIVQQCIKVESLDCSFFSPKK